MSAGGGRNNYLYMDIWQTDKLVLFLLFFIPGFISIKAYQLLVATEKLKFADIFAEAVCYSAINFAFFFWVIILINNNGFQNIHPFWYYFILTCIIFITPILWAILYLRVAKWKPLRKYLISPIKNAWDFYFDQRKSCWVIINLKTDEKVGGSYSGKSFASSFPSKEQIYLEELWEIDKNGKFIKKLDRTNGILILGDQIKSIEFYT